MKSTAILASMAFCALASVALAQTPPPGGGLQRADANGDGVITRAEFDATAAARFARMDVNSDGSVTANERPQRDGAGGPPPGAPARANPDANGDGTVTRVEFDAAQAAMFTRLDANHDGSIQTSELPQRPPGQ